MTNSQRIRELIYKAKADRLQKALDNVVASLKDGTLVHEMMQSLYDMKLKDRLSIAWKVIRGK